MSEKAGTAILENVRMNRGTGNCGLGISLGAEKLTRFNCCDSNVLNDGLRR